MVLPLLFISANYLYVERVRDGNGDIALCHCSLVMVRSQHTQGPATLRKVGNSWKSEELFLFSSSLEQEEDLWSPLGQEEELWLKTGCGESRSVCLKSVCV